MGKTKIEWTDAVWNPVTGCTKISAGCKNCYAERMHSRFSNKPFSEILLYPKRLDHPLHWRKPSRIFVNSMSDLFHEVVPDWFIDQVFAVMALCPQHKFQILTKRPERMLEYCKSLGHHHNSDRVYLVAKQVSTETGFFYTLGANGWQLSNVWLGVSVENQETADERIPLLLQTPAAVRFVSIEPLLSVLILKDEWLWLGCRPTMDLPVDAGKLDWVIVGGESGPGARPMHPDWARSLRDQATAAGVPFFFKQWGEWSPADPKAQVYRHCVSVHPNGDTSLRNDSKECIDMDRIGKKAAGRLLNGREWNEFPEIYGESPKVEGEG
jgi:protein gp37